MSEDDAEASEDLAILILDRDETRALALAQLFEPDIVFHEVDFSSSLQGGLEYLAESEYQVCFIADIYPERMLREFFKDRKKLEMTEICKFLYAYDTSRTFIGSTHDKTLVSIDPDIYEGIGFDAFIGRDGTGEDIEVLAEVLNIYSRARDVRDRSEHVKELVELVLVELDRVAMSMRRGRKKKFNTIIAQFVQKETAFDSKVLLSYFEELLLRSGEAAPFDPALISSPSIGAHLPGMDADGVYAGTSERVFDKLTSLEERIQAGEIEIAETPEPIEDGEIENDV